MDPVSWGLLIAAAISAVVSVDQGMRQQKTQNYNAKVLETQAVQARQLGEIEREREVRLGARRAASIQAKAAGAGLSLTGSVDDVFKDQIAESSRNAAMAVMRSSYSANLYEAQAAGRRMQGDDAFQGGLISGAATLASAGVSVGSGAFSSSPTAGTTGGAVRVAPAGQARGFTGGRFGGGV